MTLILYCQSCLLFRPLVALILVMALILVAMVLIMVATALILIKRALDGQPQHIWSQLVDACTFAYNTTPHDEIGETPFVMLH